MRVIARMKPAKPIDIVRHRMGSDRSAADVADPWAATPRGGIVEQTV
jgi:hypothetical protein